GAKLDAAWARVHLLVSCTVANGVRPLRQRIAFGMDGLNWFVAIIVGGLAGWIAERVMESRMGLFRNILLGIIGAVVGGFLAAQWDIPYSGFWKNLIVATLGAILVIFLYRAIRGRRA